MSRIVGPDTPPIEFEGMRYAQIINAAKDGLERRPGYLSVTEIATGLRIAAIKAYPIAFDPDMEADVQDVFFKRMKLDDTNRRLLVESERGQCAHVAIDGHAVTPAP